MKVTVSDANTATVEFADESELRAEYAANISAGGLCLATSTRLPEFTPLQLTLKLNGNQAVARVTVVRVMDNAMAVAFDAKPDEILAALTASKSNVMMATQSEGSAPRAEVNAWDRVRNLTRTEKLLLAPKADRSERAVLAQDNDPQVLQALLRNPRITIEEVARLARLPLLSATTAELIAKTTQWATAPEVRSALVHNPRTPTPLALRLLPTLPEPEIRQIAKSTAVNQALKQAALRMVINRS
jgi:hypothetical protein